MKIKTYIIALVLSICASTVNAQMSRTQVESGIASVEKLVDSHNWHEAFAKLRAIDTSIGNDNTLHYLVMKQRFRMYSRLGKGAEVKNCLSGMESLAMSSKDNATIEDMLMTKAMYASSTGNHRVSRDCYTQIFDRRSTGKDDKGKDACFQKMISEAKSAKNSSMQTVMTELYTAWQDSIAAVRAAKELSDLKVEFAGAQEEIATKESKISLQWGVIVTLGILLVAVTLALAFFILIMFKNVRKINKLKKSLEVSNANSEQKSAFMRNISKQIIPSLTQISQGNASKHIDALNRMLNDVEKYIEIDSTKEERYEKKESNISKIFEDIVNICANKGITVTTEVSKISFSVNADAIKEIITNIISEASKTPGIERITLGFNKRNPQTAQLMVTAIGPKVTEEQKATIFIAFAKVYDLTETSGIVLPTCALMAYKMGGTLSVDDKFAKGTRFILEIKN